MKTYKYHPIRFYITCFIATWTFWILAIFIKENSLSSIFMFLGLISPAITALITVLTSKSKALKQDLKRKLISFYRIKPFNILIAVLTFTCIVILSIGLSLFFGQSIDQFSFTDGFSFSIKGTSALATILLASIIEEIGWRGYGEDSIANYCSWFHESILFGIIWALWHLPLFFIEGTYHFGLSELGIGYVLNFLISVIPLGFLTTWVYVKNNRSMLACIIFHLFVNTMQEKIAMTPQTKCIETIVVIVVAILVVILNKNLFFEKEHIGHILKE
ncbi:MAG: type II CAAX prenyl endopeptidase Rce1 family protein [Floccifex sp.]